jgi:hypothetical protein
MAILPGSRKTGSSFKALINLRLAESQQFLEPGIYIEHDLSAAMRAAGKHLVGDVRVLQREHSADVRNQFSAVF